MTAALTESASRFGSSDEKVDQPTDAMKAEDDNHPDEFLDAVESTIRDGMNEHPNPKDAGCNR